MWRRVSEALRTWRGEDETYHSCEDGGLYEEMNPVKAEKSKAPNRLSWFSAFWLVVMSAGLITGIITGNHALTDGGINGLLGWAIGRFWL